MNKDFLKYSLSAPVRVGKSYFSVILFCIIIYLVSYLLNFILYPILKILGFDGTQQIDNSILIQLSLYLVSFVNTLFDYFYVGMLFFVVWKIDDIKYVLPRDFKIFFKNYFRSIISVSIIQFIILNIVWYIFENSLDMYAKWRMETEIIVYSIDSYFYYENFVRPFFELAFLIVLGSCMINGTSILRGLREFWIFLNQAKVSVILISYGYLIGYKYISQDWFNNEVLKPIITKIHLEGNVTNIISSYIIPFGWQTMMGMIFILLYVIPIAAMVHYYKYQKD